ncbi:hypothetical protein [Acaryochloris sp. IP29b_bin.148]|uniref:hypothetical protein n=1 Tax=Acaryochloris sp. IP29b_bin.148 TaxID=2969218 RepID=UPI002636066F|nr:hypothetical protein [Acaryochloris sp. IP29b_bin.148]
MHPSLKKQLILVLVGCVVLTVGFGLLLSVAVNLSLQGLEQRPDLEILPPGAGESTTQP